VRMTIEDRDQWECLLADWSAAYDITRSDDEDDELPFKAVPHADPGALLEAASPRLLRAMIREDRRARYRGLPRTRLDHVYMACALNLLRLEAYWTGTPLDRQRTSHLARSNSASSHDPELTTRIRDAELGVAGASLSPGLAAMNDKAAAAGPFANHGGRLHRDRRTWLARLTLVRRATRRYGHIAGPG